MPWTNLASAYTLTTTFWSVKVRCLTGRLQFSLSHIQPGSSFSSSSSSLTLLFSSSKLSQSTLLSIASSFLILVSRSFVLRLSLTFGYLF